MPTTVNEVTSSIWIDAPVETVWNAVTSPALIKRWFFGVDTDADGASAAGCPSRHLSGQAVRGLGRDRRARSATAPGAHPLE